MKVFHGIEIPDQIYQEMIERFGADFTVGHIVGWLLEREIAREVAGENHVAPKQGTWVCSRNDSPQLCIAKSVGKPGYYLAASDEETVMLFYSRESAENFINTNKLVERYFPREVVKK